MRSLHPSLPFIRLLECRGCGGAGHGAFLSRRGTPGPVERIRDHWRGGMTWRQPRPFYPEFELRRGGHLFAELEFPSGWILRATGKAFDRSWRLEQKGFWRRTVSMVDVHTGREVLELRLPVWRKAALTTSQGRTYTARAGFTHYRIEDEDGMILVRFPFKFRLFRLEADVEVSERAAALPELPELVVAGWFLAVLVMRQATTASGSGAATS